ncbi:hypothetical protein Q4493_15260 [Colwellia sp. 1_MG-2023]|uniref:hypothetical protein n=1 Tax=Colwellia sp. 1_MG-2023 TaxID=3062649 RepID=UPI0026E1F9D8|nr:hypothetical protein [Colwellia sp. 1_MG-2023]MDO6447129.1 hypothetical protein [Colwellia sp. 1_MG-2023]
MKILKQLVLLFALSTPLYSLAGIIFINEIHYDNIGTDQHEFFELMAEAGTDLTGWQVELYNGSNGATYGNAINLSGIISDTNNGFGFASFSPSNIQNGAPDGLALIDNLGVVRQFLSYEGTITATSGTAIGLTSTDIGISESSSTTPSNFSLQLTGTGYHYQDFSWQAMTHTSGAINSQQIIKTRNNVTVSEPSALELLLMALALLVLLKVSSAHSFGRFVYESA